MTTRTAYTADTLTSSSISSDEKTAFADGSAPKCPATGKTYDYQAPRDGDIRSVCPALNTMANHGYIPRDGKNISYFTLVRGLKKCYGLTTPLALFLAAGGFFLIKKFTSTNLFNFGKHGGVEHDASLVHRDTPPKEEYGPIDIVPEWVPEIVGDIEPKVEVDAVNLETLINEEDIGRSRVRREKRSPPLDALHAELARGEMAIIIGVWERKHASSNKTGIPVPHLLQWLEHERLPEGWKPDHKQGLRDVRRRSKLIKKTMDSIRAEEEQSEKTK